MTEFNICCACLANKDLIAVTVPFLGHGYICNPCADQFKEELLINDKKFVKKFLAKKRREKYDREEAEQRQTNSKNR